VKWILEQGVVQRADGRPGVARDQRVPDRQPRPREPHAGVAQPQIRPNVVFTRCYGRPLSYLKSQAASCSGRGLLAFVLAAILTGGALNAQETTGSLRGRVVSPAVNAVASAQVSATGPNLQGNQTVVSGPDGIFELLTLPPGLYTLRIVAIGHRPLVIEEALVQLGRTTGLGDLTVEPAPMELGEQRGEAVR